MADLKSCYLIETSELTLSFVNTDDPLPPIQEVIVGESNVSPKHPSDLILDPLDQGARALDGCEFLRSMDYLDNSLRFDNIHFRDGLGTSDSNVSPKPPKRKYNRSGKFSKETGVMSDSNVSPKPPKRKYNRSGKFGKETANAAKIESRDERKTAISKIKSAIPGMSEGIENSGAVEIAAKYIEFIQIKLDSKKEVEFCRQIALDHHRGN